MSVPVSGTSVSLVGTTILLYQIFTCEVQHISTLEGYRQVTFVSKRRKILHVMLISCAHHKHGKTREHSRKIVHLPPQKKDQILKDRHAIKTQIFDKLFLCYGKKIPWNKPRPKTLTRQATQCTAPQEQATSRRKEIVGNKSKHIENKNKL